MKIKLLTAMAGPDCEAAYPGDVVDLPDDFAKRLLSAGAAELVVEAHTELPVEALEAQAKEVKSRGKKKETTKTDPKSETSEAEG